MNNKITHGPINLGNPFELTILEIAEKIKWISNSNSTIQFMPLPSDDPMKRKPDITKASNILNWKPKINVDEGLKKTYDYFKNI